MKTKTVKRAKRGTIEFVLADILKRAKKIKDYRERNRHIWNLVSLFRGPDDDNLSLKDLTTARLRSVVGLSNLDYAPYITTDTPLDSRRIIERTRRLHEGQPHFQAHYKHAAEAVRKIFGYDLLAEQKVGR